MKNEFSLLMKYYNLGGFLIENPSDYFWLTGFSGDECFCCALPDRVMLVVDSRYTEQAKMETSDFMKQQRSEPDPDEESD